MNNVSVLTELNLLLQNGHRRRLPKGQVITSLGENLGLAIVESGYIKRYLITREGNQSVQSIYGPGDIFPLTPVFKTVFNLDIGEKEEILYYEPISTAQVRSITMSRLHDYAEQNPRTYKELLYVAGIRLSSNIQRLGNMSLANSYRRVAHQLTYFAEEFGQKTDTGTKILLPLTNAELANILNLARETVSRCITRLQQKQLIKTGKHFVVIDIEKLRQEIY